MHKLIWGISILLWLATIIIAIILIQAHGFWSITPIFSHNRPHGIIGWLLIISVISTIIAGDYNHLTPHKN